MTWDSFHRRGDVLRAVTEEANNRCDGVLPMDLPGVAETFDDELDLLAALQLRWYTLLSGQIDRMMVDEPVDLEQAVVDAWRASAATLPGVRAVLDRAREHGSAEVVSALAASTAKERHMLALMAGRASQFDLDERAVRAGALIEQRAREGLVLVPVPRTSRRFIDRLRELVA